MARHLTSPVSSRRSGGATVYVEAWNQARDVWISGPPPPALHPRLCPTSDISVVPATPITTGNMPPGTPIRLPTGQDTYHTAIAWGELGPSLLGDKSHSLVFDNSKVKALVPEFICTVPFALGARQILNWFDANPDQQIVDEGLNATFDQLIAVAGRQ